MDPDNDWDKVQFGIVFESIRTMFACILSTLVVIGCLALIWLNFKRFSHDTAWCTEIRCLFSSSSSKSTNLKKISSLLSYIYCQIISFRWLIQQNKKKYVLCTLRVKNTCAGVAITRITSAHRHFGIWPTSDDDDRLVVGFFGLVVCMMRIQSSACLIATLKKIILLVKGQELNASHFICNII